MSLRAYFAQMRKGRLVAALVVVLAIIGAIIGIVASGSKSPTSATNGGGPRNTQPKLVSTNCPLTDTPAPGGKVPVREPLAVKIGNETTARPQSGLNEADIVFATPAEGGIMRYIAVFQCNDAASIGPVRSVRWVDYHILQVFKHAALGFVGGVIPNQQAVASSSFLDDANDFLHFAAYHTDPARIAPDATYSSTKALWSLFGRHAAPQPIFRFTPALPANESHPASSLAINFSYGTDVVWKWDASIGQWVHTYAGSGTDIDALTRKPVTATNVVVQIVHYTIGPYVESTGGSGDVQSQTVGTEHGWIFRNGQYVRVTWHRTSLNSTTTYIDAKGQQVGLAPGRTWVEYVLDTTAKQKGAITITP